MRRVFFKELYKHMKKNKKIYALTGDLGYIGFDKIRDEFPDRFCNCGASECAMLDIAVGLALSGKIPFVYSITPFLLYRGFETIRTYINHEVINVKLIGSGRDKDYEIDGFSHHGEDDREIMRVFTKINKKSPHCKDAIPELMDEMIRVNIPFYLNLRR